MSSIGHALRTHRHIFVLITAIFALLLLGLFLFAGLGLLQSPSRKTLEISFSQLLDDVDAGRVRDIRINGTEIYGTFNNGADFQTYVPTDPTLIQRLNDKGVSITTRP